MVEWVRDLGDLDGDLSGAAGDGRLSLRGLAGAVLDGWRRVAAVTLAAAALAVIALHLWPPQYTAALVVGPTARSGLAAMGARLPRFGQDMPPAVAEYGLGDEMLSDFARFIELVASPPVAERLLASEEVARRLFPEEWDPAAAAWQPPGGMLAGLHQGFQRLVGREPWSPPDSVRLARLLRQRVVVSAVGTTPMRRITFRHRDRAFAVDLLGRLHAAADEQLRREAVRRTGAQVAFIKEQLATVTVAEHRRALVDLLSDLERTRMVVEVDLPFAADPIEPAFAPALPDWPEPLVVVPLSAAAGLALGVFLVCARGAWPGGRPRIGA